MRKHINEYSLGELRRRENPNTNIHNYSRTDYSYGCTIISWSRRVKASTYFKYGFLTLGVALPGMSVIDYAARQDRETHYFYAENGEELGSSKEEAINRAATTGEELEKEKNYTEASCYFNVAYHLCDDSRVERFKEKRDKAIEDNRQEKEKRGKMEQEAKEQEDSEEEESEEKENEEEESEGEDSEEEESEEKENEEEESEGEETEEEESEEENEYEGREEEIDRDEREQNERERKKREREAKDIYLKAQRMWNEAFILENNNSVAEAKEKFEGSNKLFLKASTIIPNEVLYCNWFHISSLKLAGDSLFNEALSLQEQGNLLRQKQKYEQALIKYQDAQNKYTEGFNKSKDTRFKACIEFVESCIKEVNDLIQVGDIEEQIHNIQVETGRNNVNTEEDTNEETILHQLIDA